jgi:hypothetical protein
LQDELYNARQQIEQLTAELAIAKAQITAAAHNPSESLLVR